jgi:predicted TIM-barrel fold metal-dependent hydrolase
MARFGGDHVVEKPTLWTERLPAKYREVGPKVEIRNGVEAWVYEDRAMPTLGLAAVVGRKKETWSPAPINYTDMHPGCFDPAARIADMNVAGILAQTCFPSFPRFCGQVFLEAEDRQLALLCIRAWNDHMREEWAGEFPGRFITLAMVPLWDPELAASEAVRALEAGANAILFSENISRLGQPSVHDKGGHWDPLFQVANERGAPICVHLGSSSSLPATSEDCPSIIPIALNSLNMAGALADFLFGGHFFRYPNLKLVLSESEIGWIPYVLMWWDHVAATQQWAARGEFSMNLELADFSERSIGQTKIIDPDIKPSELFRSHAYGCFIDDRVGVRLIDEIGVDNVMVETDYPHSDSTWPNSIKVIREQLAGLSKEDQEKILVGNASRVFRFEPAQPAISNGGSL